MKTEIVSKLCNVYSKSNRMCPIIKDFCYKEACEWYKRGCPAHPAILAEILDELYDRS